MSSVDTSDAVSALLTSRRLLNHPFYRRWETGEVSTAELAAYAAQYRYFESYLPSFLTRLVGELPEGHGRRLIAANLADEQGDPVAHVELFERFASAVGAGPAACSAAMAHLLATYDGLLDAGPLDALAGFVAYEVQASGVAWRKAEGLRRHYGLDATAVSFWAHHASVDVQHGEWALRALAEVCGGSELPLRAVGRAGDAWWGFLDEREALAAPMT